MLLSSILQKEHHEALLQNLVHCKNMNKRFGGLQKMMKRGCRMFEEAWNQKMVAAASQARMYRTNGIQV